MSFNFAKNRLRRESETNIKKIGVNEKQIRSEFEANVVRIGSKFEKN